MKEKNNERLKLYCTHFMLRTGTSPSLKGFQLIRDAVALYYNGMRKMDDIQVALSKQYKISKSAVERNIRFILNGIYNRGAQFHLNNLIGYNLFLSSEPITAKQFLAMICETYEVDSIYNKIAMCDIAN